MRTLELLAPAKNLECGLAAIWFGEQVACWRDTQALNRSLRQFQEET